MDDYDNLRADYERLRDVADAPLRDALSAESDAVRRAESAELGCEIAYRREPTQAEGDAHEIPGAPEAIRECHVSMGNHHGHRCRCGRWVWGGPTGCQRCTDTDAVHAAIARADVYREHDAHLSTLLTVAERERDDARALYRDTDVARSRALADLATARELLKEGSGCMAMHAYDCDRDPCCTCGADEFWTRVAALLGKEGT